MLNKKQKRFLLPCLIATIGCLLIASFSGWVTAIHIQTWFVHLVKPSFNPPSWLFGPVWTVLYILIGISGGILWVYRDEMRLSFNYYLAQLVLNFAWSFIFFGAQKIGWALVDMSLLLILVLLTMITCWRNVRVVVYLFLPYFAWLCFAFRLNYCLWILN